MLEMLKTNAIPLAVLCAGIIASHTLHGYRIEAVEKEMLKREANLVKQAELDKRVAVLETQYTFIMAAIKKNTELGEELKELILEGK